MIVTADTACGRNDVRVNSKDLRSYDWGTVAMCCGSCTNVVLARNSWYEVYA